jgi:hypothetical protein
LSRPKNSGSSIRNTREYFLRICVSGNKQLGHRIIAVSSNLTRFVITKQERIAVFGALLLDGNVLNVLCLESVFYVCYLDDLREREFSLYRESGNLGNPS